MELGLKDKVVVITGGTAGIGKAIAYGFAREGCKLAVCGRDKHKLHATVSEFNQKGFSILAESADVSDYHDLEAFAESTNRTYGAIDIWINNAGLLVQKAIVDTTEEEWAQVMNVDLKSVFFGCKIAAKYMKPKNGGVIINASSYAALNPCTGTGVYNAAKAAILNFTRTLAGELAPFHIRVNAYVPGSIMTEMLRSKIKKDANLLNKLNSCIALNKVGTPEDVSNCVVFLASEAAGYLTGTFIEISGGKYCVQSPHDAWKV